MGTSDGESMSSAKAPSSISRVPQRRVTQLATEDSDPDALGAGLADRRRELERIGRDCARDGDRDLLS